MNQIAFSRREETQCALTLFLPGGEKEAFLETVGFHPMSPNLLFKGVEKAGGEALVLLDLDQDDQWPRERLQGDALERSFPTLGFQMFLNHNTQKPSLLAVLARISGNCSPRTSRDPSLVAADSRLTETR